MERKRGLVGVDRSRDLPILDDLFSIRTAMPFPLDSGLHISL